MAGRAVVTGGAGFIGSHLCERLVDDGWAVVCVDSFVTGRPANIDHLTERDSFGLVHCDVTECVRVTGPVDVVLHFACPASPVDYLRLPVETLRVGSVGTFHALDIAVDKGARFLLASTSEVYGDPLVHPQHEQYWGNVNPIGPRSVYDEAKRFAEALTMAYGSTYGLDTAIVRIFNTFGPRMRINDGRAVPTFVRQALCGEPLTVAGDGSQTRSMCYVDDVVDGIVRMLHANHPGPINLGNPHELSILELARRIKDLAGSTSEIEFIQRPKDDPQLRQPDISMARDVLAWEPKIAVDDGLRRTIAWFRDTAEI